MAPAILFIDEIDGIGKRQPAEREHADYWNALVNKALELLDGAVKSEGLIIVGEEDEVMLLAACNVHEKTVGKALEILEAAA